MKNKTTSVLTKRLKEYSELLSSKNEAAWLNYIFELDASSMLSASMSRARLIMVTLGTNKNSIRFALAVEFIHNASLIVDDMIDRSILRRGRSSFWKKFGEREAILYSHVLIQKAFKEILDIDINSQVRDELLKQLLSIVQEMALNEIHASHSELIEIEDYIERITPRTGLLYGFVGKIMALSPVLRNNEESLIEILTQIGSAHQIWDDISDANPTVDHSNVFIDKQAEINNFNDSIFALINNAFDIEEIRLFHKKKSQTALSSLEKIVAAHPQSNAIMYTANEVCGIKDINFN